VWRWGPLPAFLFDRRGQRCRILSCGEMNARTIEFEDGFQVVASRYAIRKPRKDSERGNL